MVHGARLVRCGVLVGYVLVGWGLGPDVGWVLCLVCCLCAVLHEVRGLLFCFVSCIFGSSRFKHVGVIAEEGVGY